MTSKQFASVLFFILVSTAASPVSAEFFRYVDKHGNVIYTDDLNRVPADQRHQLKAYEEAPPSARLEQAPETKAGPESANDDPDLQERQRLQEMERTLGREYENLMAERTALAEEKKNAVSADQIKIYNQKSMEFNDRIQAYEKKRNALEADAKSFNDRLEARQKQNTGKP